MGETTTKEEIERFLKELKGREKIYVVDERKDGKNDDTLAALGISPKHREEIIRALKYSDYYKGPSPDHSKERSEEQFWEFGKKVQGEEIYIKVKVYATRTGKRSGKCLSFHIAERSIKYPFKNEKE